MERVQAVERAIGEAIRLSVRRVLHELHGAEGVFSDLPGFEEVDQDLIDAVLEEGARVCEEVVAPLNRGCRRGRAAGWTRRASGRRQGFRQAYAYAPGGRLVRDGELRPSTEGRDCPTRWKCSSRRCFSLPVSPSASTAA